MDRLGLQLCFALAPNLLLRSLLLLLLSALALFVLLVFLLSPAAVDPFRASVGATGDSVFAVSSRCSRFACSLGCYLTSAPPSST